MIVVNTFINLYLLVLDFYKVC